MKKSIHIKAMPQRGSRQGYRLFQHQILSSSTLCHDIINKKTIHNTFSGRNQSSQPPGMPRRGSTLIKSNMLKDYSALPWDKIFFQTGTKAILVHCSQSKVSLVKHKQMRSNKKCVKGYFFNSSKWHRSQWPALKFYLSTLPSIVEVKSAMIQMYMWYLNICMVMLIISKPNATQDRQEASANSIDTDTMCQK